MTLYGLDMAWIDSNQVATLVSLEHFHNIVTGFTLS